MQDATDPRAWFQRTRVDLRSASNDLADDPDALAEIICYNAHQACEKALKGFLLAHGETALRTHDLLILLDERQRFAPMLAAYRDSLIRLNPYNLQACYPGTLMSGVDGDSAQGAYESALAVVDAPQGLLGRS